MIFKPEDTVGNTWIDFNNTVVNEVHSKFLPCSPSIMVVTIIKTDRKAHSQVIITKLIY